MTRCVLETRGFVKRFGRGGSAQTAVDHVSLYVDEGKVYVLLGPNGAGKSTTLKMIAGMLHPTKGHGLHQAAYVTDDTHAGRGSKRGAAVAPQCAPRRSPEHRLSRAAQNGGARRRDKLFERHVAVRREPARVHAQKHARRPVEDEGLPLGHPLDADVCADHPHRGQARPLDEGWVGPVEEHGEVTEVVPERLLDAPRGSCASPASSRREGCEHLREENFLDPLGYLGLALVAHVVDAREVRVERGPRDAGSSAHLAHSDALYRVVPHDLEQTIGDAPLRRRHGPGIAFSHGSSSRKSDTSARSVA
nr:ATP-binding cassette domain-containing protein [Olsenella profusa]